MRCHERGVRECTTLLISLVQLNTESEDLHFSENANDHKVTRTLNLFSRTRLLYRCGVTRIRNRTRALRASHLLVQSLPNLLLLCRP